MANFCTKCGTALQEGARFCGKCGAAVQDAPQPEMPPPPLAEPAQEPPVAEQPAAVPQEQPQPPFGAQPGVYPGAAFAPTAHGSEQGHKKRGLFAVLGGIAAIIILALILTLAIDGGEKDVGYYQIGGERIQSVAFALGESRKVQSIKRSVKNGVETLSIDYGVPGKEQGEDVRTFLAYLQRKDGFTALGDINDVTFAKKTGSRIQIWRSAEEPGYMIVVQADYDARGYTITLMYGEGQVAMGETPAGTPAPQPQTTQPPPYDPPATEQPAATVPPNDFSALLPAGEPVDSDTINGYKIDIYKNGTVSLNDGRGIILPNGTVYINGTPRDSIDMIEIPDGGTIAYYDECAVAIVDGQLYVAANGGLICVDRDGNASVYSTP
ncbi:MAG: zinc ribbon domain-containing protein [Christensenellaceae bacterium]|jgi:hypothetical protein|nr:zinc ribbon domain-containing protein [Christensenellaceae bacterium]